jgi:adenosylmethionine-8-amino-7-oxononanoate aminotransferase
VSTEHPTPDELVALDRQVLWHPFTQHAAWGVTDPVLVVDRAEGFHLIAADGRRYLDGVSSLWCNVHGHRVPELDQALREQLDKVAHSTLLGLSQSEAILLARDLVACAPAGLQRVFFTDAGATAVEAALKMAVQYQAQRGRPRKKRFLALGEAYHGDTMGAVSLGYTDWFHRAFQHLTFETLTVPPPHAFALEGAAPDAAARAVVDMVARHADDLAAVVMEPVMQGAAGMLPQPAGYVRAVAEACRAHKVLFIADEVATGLGRTGRLWACDHDGVTPDILCVAKGLSGGYLPVAATLTTEEVFDAFKARPEEGRQFFHGHTFTGNALGCAVARASLRLLRERVMPGLPERVALLQSLLEPLKAHPHVAEVRQRGLMVGIELVQDRAKRTAYPRAARTGHQVCMAARDHGVVIRPLLDVVVLMPAPAMPAELLTELVAVTRACIDRVTLEKSP